MSVNLTPVDLSAVTPGTSDKLDWTGQIQSGTPIGTKAGRATLRLFNESNAGLQLSVSGLLGTFLPAGGWGDVPLTGQNSLIWTALYVISGTSPNVLVGVLYEPGEPVPPMPVLGNSAVSVGGVVNTATSSALKNDGNGPGLQIIESTPSDQAASSLGIDNDGSGFWKVLSANVLRIVANVVRGSVSLKASIQFGDAGDATITTFYGSLQGGQPASVGVMTSTSISSDGAKVTTNGSGALTIGSLSSDGAKVTTNGTGTLTIAELSSDAGKVTTDGAGNETVTGTMTMGKISSDGGLILSDTAGHLSGLTITAAGISLSSLAATGDSTIFNNNGFRNRAVQITTQQIAVTPTHGVLVSWDGANGHACFGWGSNSAGDTGAYVDDSSNHFMSSIPTLITGHQDTGKAGIAGTASVASQLWAVSVGFHLHMTNTPSSITLTVNASTNCTISAANITKDGFDLVATATAAGNFSWDGTYTTVGN